MLESRASRRVVVGSSALSVVLCLFAWLFSSPSTADTIFVLRVAYAFIAVGSGGVLLDLAKRWIDRGTSARTPGETVRWVRWGDVVVPCVLRKTREASRYDDGRTLVQVGPPRKLPGGGVR